MATSVQPPVRRRFTVVELLVVVSLLALLAIIAVPVLRDNEIGQAQEQAERQVQDAVRRYTFDTHAYPTLAPPEALEPVTDPWQPGSLPSVNSVPPYAGLNFDAPAIKLALGQTVRLVPDYMAKRPKYATEAASDGTQRWRIDAEGNVRVQMDGRSY